MQVTILHVLLQLLQGHQVCKAEGNTPIHQFLWTMINEYKGGWLRRQSRLIVAKE